MGLWSFDLITEPLSWWKNRLHHESGEPIEEPIHPGQQRRTRQGQEVFSVDYLSSARVDQHTGWRYWPSSPSSSWWYASEWSWKWAHNFFLESLFCYSWFRLQLIAIHCSRRGVRTEHLTPRIFSHICTHFILVHMHRMGSRCRTTCLAKRAFHPHVIMCLIVRCLSSLWSLPLFRVSLLFVHFLHLLCPGHHPPCRWNRRALNPLRARRMRIVPWWYTTLSRVMTPTSSTIPTAQRLLHWSSSMNPST